MDKKGVFKNILLFLIIFLALNLLFKGCQSGTTEPTILDQGQIGFITTETTYSRTDTITVTFKNNTATAIIIPLECPNEPLDVFHYENGGWAKIEAKPELDCSKAAPYEIKPGETLNIPYDNWNHDLFSRMGRFKIAVTLNLPEVPATTTTLTTSPATTTPATTTTPTTSTTPTPPITPEPQKLVQKTIESNEFSVEEEGIFSKLWTGIFYRPIYNVLIFLIAYMPGNSLGLAIIILTIIIRTILLAPSQKAMKAQRKMQMVQPMIESIKEKYKGDKQRIAQETMAVWKTQKVNPLGSCLPLLLQFPVLIALFYVVQGGLNPDNTYLLYTSYSNFSFLNISTNFLGLDLLKNNLYVLPLVVGLLTFAQMKLSTAMAGKKKDSKPKEMALASNMMVYFMPVMVAVFTASLPSGVGVYWGVSTLYGVIQQYFVNKAKPGKEKDDDVQVRVIEHKEENEALPEGKPEDKNS